MPVSPFGAPVDVRAWELFARDSGIAVVIDAIGTLLLLRERALGQKHKGSEGKARQEGLFHC